MAETVVGVPVIAPVALLMSRPAGSIGLTRYLVTAPPELDGLLAVMAVPTV